LLLAVWLLLPHGRYFVWLTAVLTFAAFGVVSGYWGWIGQASCGCFGPVPVSPWVAFGIDVAALGLLLAAKPKWTSWRSETPALCRVAVLAVSGAIAAAVSIHRFGSVDAGLSYLRGDKLLAVPAVIDFGIGRPGDDSYCDCLPIIVIGQG